MADTLKTDAVNAGIMPDYSRAGVVLCRSGEFLVDASDNGVDADDVIQMVPVPSGAHILDIQVYICSNTSNGDMEIGDGGDTNRYFDDLDASADGGFNLIEDGTSNGQGFRYTNNDTIDLKALGTPLSTGTKVRMHVFYKMTGSIEDETTGDCA